MWNLDISYKKGVLTKTYNVIKGQGKVEDIWGYRGPALFPPSSYICPKQFGQRKLELGVDS